MLFFSFENLFFRVHSTGYEIKLTFVEATTNPLDTEVMADLEFEFQISLLTVVLG